MSDTNCCIEVHLLCTFPIEPLVQYEQWEWILRFYINDQKDKMSLEFLLLNSFEIR